VAKSFKSIAGIGAVDKINGLSRSQVDGSEERARGALIWRKNKQRSLKQGWLMSTDF